MLKELDKLNVRIGFQAGEAKYDDGTDVAEIALYNELGTSSIPSRPFLRDSVDNHESEINAFFKTSKKSMLAGKDAEAILKEVGIFMKDLVQGEITDGSFAPNAPSTIARKGSSKPLIDTGKMRQSVNYVIKQKGEE